MSTVIRAELPVGFPTAGAAAEPTPIPVQRPEG